MSTRSRFGLLAESLTYTGPEDKLPAPTCNPCRERDHVRCPQAITEHSSPGFSTYVCACYGEDPSMHADLVEDRDEQRWEHEVIRRERREAGHDWENYR
jgi:hypothetical protein